MDLKNLHDLYICYLIVESVQTTATGLSALSERKIQS